MFCLCFATGVLLGREVCIFYLMPAVTNIPLELEKQYSFLSCYLRVLGFPQCYCLAVCRWDAKLSNNFSLEVTVEYLNHGSESTFTLLYLFLLKACDIQLCSSFIRDFMFPGTYSWTRLLSQKCAIYLLLHMYVERCEEGSGSFFFFPLSGFPNKFVGLLSGFTLKQCPLLLWLLGHTWKKKVQIISKTLLLASRGVPRA